MTPRAVREYVEALRSRYEKGSKAEKGGILDEFCRTTGYHRISAIRLFGRTGEGKAVRRGRPTRYGAEERVAIRCLW